MEAIQSSSTENAVPTLVSENTIPKQQSLDSEENTLIISPQTKSKSPEPSSSNGHSQHDTRPRSSTDVRHIRNHPRSPTSPGTSDSHRNQRLRSKSHSISSTSSENMHLEDSFPEDDNRTREREMWAMLAGQTAFKFESYIFQRVLPKSLIKPHIFPRHVEDMETLIEKYMSTGKTQRLEGAAEKWATLKTEWKWRKAHGLVIGTAKSAYLHISNPLEVMMKLDREKGDSLEDARRAYRNVLPGNLHEPGQEVVELMHVIGLLTDKSSPPSPM
ncbi:uncharacterized protein LOC129277873 [Lytechinus pictus]|uniref:uncharacterized protein LOC129277873 n=1 Tax=Lytechinus pictus TaxID=7653 RepID=UPI00240D7D69|nr:uncharacterized protein LOC129277873 [Lytechinus pictus]